MSSILVSKKDAVLSRSIPRWFVQNSDSNVVYFAGVVLTVLGFFIAILVSLFFPQLASIEVTAYPFLGAVSLNPDQAYRVCLIGLIIIYGGTGIYSYFNEDKRKRFIGRVPFRFVVGLALALWDVLGTKVLALPQPFFPGPSKIIESFLMEGDYIFENTLYSLRLYTIGFTLGIIFGVGTGILIGWFPKVYYWVFPVLKITGVIPAVAWMPFALTLLPTPLSAAAFLIVICAWFPVAFLTAQGIASTPKIHFEAAKTLGAKTPYLVFHVAIPHAMPQIFTGISSANGFAFTTLVMSEMMGQPGGLGYYINASKVWSAYYKVFAAIFVMGILFSAIMKVIGAIQNRVLRWQRGLIK